MRIHTSVVIIVVVIVVAHFTTFGAIALKLLGAFARINLRRVDVALGVDREVVHPMELPGGTSAPAEVCEEF